MTKPPKPTAKSATTKSATTKSATTKSTTTKSTTTKSAAKPAAKASSRRGGRVLADVQIELPHAPNHHYGLVRLVPSVQVGDVLYIGSRQNLSQLEVLAVETVDSPRRFVKIRAAAVSLWVDGVEYVDGEEIVLTATPEVRVAVRGFAG